MKRFGQTLFWSTPIILIPIWFILVMVIPGLNLYGVAVLIAAPIFAAIAMTGGWILAHPTEYKKARLPVGYLMLFIGAAVPIAIFSALTLSISVFLFYLVPLLYSISVLIGGLCLIITARSKRPSRVDTQPPDELAKRREVSKKISKREIIGWVFMGIAVIPLIGSFAISSNIKSTSPMLHPQYFGEAFLSIALFFLATSLFAIGLTFVIISVLNARKPQPPDEPGEE